MRHAKQPTKTFSVVIHEVLVHTITVEAPTEASAIRQGLAAWHQDGVGAFSSTTLGRTDLVSATEVRP